MHDSKKERKAKKRAKKQGKLICPKCSHTVAQHQRSYAYFSFFIGEAQHAGCQGQIESRDVNGLIRMKACACDLSPIEALTNAERGVKVGPVDADALLRDLR
jgi:hypothetical protein